jgi:hypothetical protein
VLVITAIAVEILDTSCAAPAGNTFTLGYSFVISATLTQDRVPVSAEIVTFNAGIGQLSTATKLTDTASQPIPSRSTIAITSAAGELNGTVTDVMPQSNRNGVRTQVFSLTNNENTNRIIIHLKLG